MGRSASAPTRRAAPASGFTSLVQSRLPPELRGRAFAGFDLLWQTGRLLSLLGGGLLADGFGIRAAYGLGGVLLLAAAGIGAAGARWQQTSGLPTKRRRASQAVGARHPRAGPSLSQRLPLPQTALDC